MVKEPKKILIDNEQVRKMASYGCTNEDIADFFGCARATIQRNYQEVMQQGRAEMRSNLRKKQIEVAMSGQATMLIWLGKCVLGQVEFCEDEVRQIKEILIKIDPARVKHDNEETIQTEMD